MEHQYRGATSQLDSECLYGTDIGNANDHRHRHIYSTGQGLQFTDAPNRDSGLYADRQCAGEPDALSAKYPALYPARNTGTGLWSTQWREHVPGGRSRREHFRRDSTVQLFGIVWLAACGNVVNRGDAHLSCGNVSAFRNTDYGRDLYFHCEGDRQRPEYRYSERHVQCAQCLACNILEPGGHDDSNDSDVYVDDEHTHDEPSVLVRLSRSFGN